MFFKREIENNRKYLKPIFSDFEKKYLLSEIDMIIDNGGDYFEFDTLERNQISVYLQVHRRYYVGVCSGILSDVLWTLLTTQLMVDDFYYGSYLGFAIKGSSNEPNKNRMTLDLEVEKVKQFFLSENLLKLIAGRSVISAKDFIETVKN